MPNQTTFGYTCTIAMKTIHPFVMLNRVFFVLGIVVAMILSASAQRITGTVTDSRGEALPYVNVFVKEIQSGTNTDLDGKYIMVLDPGHYQVVFSSVGYLPQEIPVVVGDRESVVNVKMQVSDVELDQILVKAKKKDAAYEIIQKVTENRDNYLKAIESYRCNLYIRAAEFFSSTDTKKNKNAELQVEFSPDDDPFEDDQADTLSKDNLVEIYSDLSFQYPSDYKDVRLGYRKYGDDRGLFIPKFSETGFNFYNNLVPLKGLSQVPLISPFSSTAILTYKYQLLSSTKEGPNLVHKIRVTPRKKGNASCEGYVYVNDSIWNINRVELDLAPDALYIYDAFSIEQSYALTDDSLWLVDRLLFKYVARQSKTKLFTGTTLLHFLNIQPNVTFPPRFFGNEVAITTREAIDRDQNYWDSTRVEPLSNKEEKVATYRDSIKRLHESEEYLDSTQKAYNKVTVGEVLWHGLGFRNNFKKSDFYHSSLLDLIDFSVIGGFRLGPYISYFRRYPSDRMLRMSGSASVGLKNGDVNGNFNFWTRYNPYKLSDFGISFGREFQSINNFDAYLNQLKRSNYILRDYFAAYHTTELFNGFYLRLGVDFSDRRSALGFDSETFIGDIIEDEEPIFFEPYQAFRSEIKFSYTPAQRFMTEPTRKVVLGSKFPTVHFQYQKGWNGLFGSDIDWDYMQVGLSHDLILGTLGNSKYTMRLGKFLNTRNVQYVDLLRFRQSDPYLFSSPLGSFQLLDTSLTTTGLFFEAHHIHHFNGALINNIPLIKKLKVRVAAGGGILYVKKDNYRHQEVFAGIERVLKIGARRRLRLGLFGVLADSNQTKTTAGWKISLDIIDTWKKDWSH